jgi:hypothetical protein
MRRKPAPRLLRPEDQHEAHVARLAWWAAFVATVAAIAVLNFVRAADAAPLPSHPVLAAVADDEEEEIFGEDELPLCKETPRGFEGECLEGEDEEEAAEGVPGECNFSAETATVSLSQHGKLRLSFKYGSFEELEAPAVAIDFHLRGPKGSLAFDVERRNLGASGTIHQTEALTKGQTTRGLATRSVTVRVSPTGAPAYCHPFLDRRLDLRRPSGHGISWLSRGSG